MPVRTAFGPSFPHPGESECYFYPVSIYQEISQRTSLLLGEPAMDRISQARVIVFGVGGVGSWCAEGLVRSGIKHLTIVDCDTVSISNVNRQLMATVRTVGMLKVDVLKERLLEIDPEAEIVAESRIFTAETAESFHLESYDYIVDAIDSLQDKKLLIEMACRTKAKVFSSMGAALKLDPTKIRVAEFWKVLGCPLARALRIKFRSENRKPARKFLCVYCDELLQNKGAPIEPDGKFGKKQINGSLVHITAIFGFTISGLILKDLAAK